MKRILIIGEMNKLMKNMNEILVNDFQVQVCALEVDSVKAMMDIVKPDLIILSLFGVYDSKHFIFDEIAQISNTVPVVTMGGKQNYEFYQEYYEREQFEPMFSPIKKSDLIAKCCEKLCEERNDEGKEENGDYILGESEVEVKLEKKKHILLVDDSPLLLRNMKAMLEPKYKISIANSGEQALRFVPKRNPDLILLDYEMPGMDGRETFQKLKEDERSRNIPVVFLTGVAEKQNIYAVLELEPAGYILKPATMDKLVSVIESAF